MINYLYLFGAIFFEVAGTLLLPASQNFTKLLPTATLTVCYLVAFYFLTFAIKTIPISVVYATWSGLGIFTIALFGYIIYNQTLNWQTVLGLFFIITGVGVLSTDFFALDFNSKRKRIISLIDFLCFYTRLVIRIITSIRFFPSTIGWKIKKIHYQCPFHYTVGASVQNVLVFSTRYPYSWYPVSKSLSFSLATIMHSL